jgi:hypothetical protein
MIVRQNLDDLVTTTIGGLRAIRLDPPQDGVPFAQKEPAIAVLPDFLSRANLPTGIVERHDVLTSYAAAIAPINQFPHRLTPAVQVLLTSVMHLVVLVFNDGTEIESMPREHLRHAEPAHVVYVLRHFQGLPLHDALWPADHPDTLTCNLYQLIYEIRGAVSSDDAPFITEGFEILMQMGREERDELLKRALTAITAYGRPYYLRMPMGGLKNEHGDLLCVLIAQDPAKPNPANS